MIWGSNRHSYCVTTRCENVLRCGIRGWKPEANDVASRYDGERLRTQDSGHKTQDFIDSEVWLGGCCFDQVLVGG
jgi:hypothetical protein